MPQEIITDYTEVAIPPPLSSFWADVRDLLGQVLNPFDLKIQSDNLFCSYNNMFRYAASNNDHKRVFAQILSRLHHNGTTIRQ